MLRAALAAAFALAILAGPLAAEAQAAGKSYRIGFLALTPGEDTTSMKALVERLNELSYHQGKNLTFEYRSAEGRPERLSQLAMELVEARPDVLIAGFGTLTGGNVTGLSGLTEIGGKRLQLLQELVPGKQLTAVLMNPDTPFTRLALKEIKTAAEAGHTRLEVLEARTADEVSDRFEVAIKAGAGSLLVLEDPLTYSLRRHISDLAAKFRLPAVYAYRDYVEAGGLMSYGTDRRQVYRRAAEYVDRILKGARPADLPVERPTKFELVINLRTARALGLAIPQALLLTADEVIR